MTTTPRHRNICTDGDVVFQGRSIRGQATESIVRLGFAHVPEGRGTFTTLTVDENLRIAAYTRRDKPAVKRDLEMVFEYFPRLRERIQQQAGTLSGGEQQMLAITRALMLSPRVMLLDEPSFGLAPLIVQEIFRIMRRINAESKCSMLLVEQNAALALDLADHAYVLETGRVVMSGPSEVEERREHPQVVIWVTEGLTMEQLVQQVVSRPANGAIYALRRAGAGNDLRLDRPLQLRPGRDGDVLDLHRLAVDAVGVSGARSSSPSPCPSSAASRSNA